MVIGFLFIPYGFPMVGVTVIVFIDRRRRWMDFTTDILSLDKPSSVTFNLVGSRLPNNHDLFFRSKQKELVEQYSAARIFLRETETDDWKHWFNPVADDVTDKAVVVR